MAKRPPYAGEGFGLLDKQSFRVDTDTGLYERATTDETTHDKLDTIAGALGVANTTPTILNKSIISAGVEYSQTLPVNTKKFLIRSRNKGQLQLAFTSGNSGTIFITIPAGASYELEAFFTSVTIYFQSTKAGDVAEIIAFT